MNKQKILIFSLSAILFLALSFIAYSWSEPTTNMPSGYTAPLNTSSTAQTKIGAITVPMVYDYNNTSYYIDPSGNSLFAGKIGIGTTTPNSKLTIGNNVGVGFDEWNDYQLLLYTGATPQASYGLGIKSGTLAFNTNGRFDFDKNGSTMMTINGGNVGIGTTSPQTKLHVNGNIITSRPSNTDHAATKEYVDNQSGGLPTGGTDGAFLRMTSNGPIWDTLLTWIGSTHTVYDCVKIGGTVFDTGTTGTICRLPSKTVPAGWTQADNWARYYPTTWGGDSCGRWKSFTETPEFANVTTTRYSRGASEWGHLNYCADITSWLTYECCTEGKPSIYHYWPYAIVTEENVKHDETNRVEVGIY